MTEKSLFKIRIVCGFVWYGCGCGGCVGERNYVSGNTSLMVI